MRTTNLTLRFAMFLVLAGSVCLVAGRCTAADPALPDADVQKIKDALPDKATAKPAKPRKLLLFYRCEGFRHTDGIVAGNKAFELMGQKTGAFSTVENAPVFCPISANALLPATMPSVWRKPSQR